VPDSDHQRDPVLIAYDGSLLAAKAMQLFVASGLALRRPVHLLTMAEHPEPIARRGREFLTSHGVQVYQHVDECRNPAERILEFALRLEVGLIVMGAYGQPRYREFMFGSVTAGVLKKTPVPLFLYH
jgi:nucleotide-binding universal stress UspA family protein